MTQSRSRVQGERGYMIQDPLNEHARCWGWIGGYVILVCLAREILLSSTINESWRQGVYIHRL